MLLIDKTLGFAQATSQPGRIGSEENNLSHATGFAAQHILFVYTNTTNLFHRYNASMFVLQQYSEIWTGVVERIDFNDCFQPVAVYRGPLSNHFKCILFVRNVKMSDAINQKNGQSTIRSDMNYQPEGTETVLMRSIVCELLQEWHAAFVWISCACTKLTKYCQHLF